MLYISPNFPKSFSAIRTEDLDDSVDLRGYAGLEVIVESNVTRVYKLNMSCVSMWDEDLYQFTFLLESGKKTIMHIPFGYFRAVRKGKPRAYERFPDSLQVCSIGFLASESRSEQRQDELLENEYQVGNQCINVPFELDIYTIKALPELDTDIVYKLRKASN